MRPQWLQNPADIKTLNLYAYHGTDLRAINHT